MIVVKSEKMKLWKFHLHEYQQEQKYLGINLVKEVQNMYSEIYKILLKEMKDDLVKQILCLRIEWLYNIKMAIGFIILRWQYSPNWSVGLTNLSQNLSFLKNQNWQNQNWQNHPKIYMEKSRKLKIGKRILKRKN